MANIAVNDTRHSPLGAIARWIAGAVNGVFTAITHRRTLRELSALDNHQLADIGLRRDQLTNSLFASERHIAR